MDRRMLRIIHDRGEGGGGGYEDGQVEDSDPTQSNNYRQQQSLIVEQLAGIAGPAGQKCTDCRTDILL